MENASKALIIAGAILISILIIALGVFIYQRASGIASDTGSMDSTKLQSINQPFENYEGEAVSGSDVRALCDLVRTNNNKYQTSAPDRVITIAGKSTAADIAEYKATIDSAKTYKVTITGYVTSGANEGVVQTITVSAGS